MTLPLPWPEPQAPDEIRDDFETFAQQFPLQDSNLASSNNAVRKLVHTAQIGYGAGAAAGTYGVFSANNLQTSGTGTAGSVGLGFHFDPASYAVSGKTTKLLLKGTLLTNAAAPTINFTLGYSAITGSAGGAGTSTLTFGAAAGSTVTFTAPGASGAANSETASFAAYAAGYYLPTVLTSGVSAANSFTSLVWQLYVLNS